MREIDRSSAFRRDYKRLVRGRYGPALRDDLEAILSDLAEGRKLPPERRDHALTGDWREYRECHVKADLLLIYSFSGANVLRLARLGTHSELFG